MLAAADVIAAATPNAILLTDFHRDLEQRALTAFQSRLDEAGLRCAAASRCGRTAMPSSLDLDGDGRTAGLRDAQGSASVARQQGAAVAPAPCQMIDHSIFL